MVETPSAPFSLPALQFSGSRLPSKFLLRNTQRLCRRRFDVGPTLRVFLERDGGAELADRFGGASGRDEGEAVVDVRADVAGRELRDAAEQFAGFRDRGLEMGFKVVESGPLVRSSYHADAQADQLTGVDRQVHERMSELIEGARARLD